MVRNQAWLAPGAMETCANQLQAAPARLSASPCRNVQHSNRLASAPWAPAQLAHPTRILVNKILRHAEWVPPKAGPAQAMGLSWRHNSLSTEQAPATLGACLACAASSLPRVPSAQPRLLAGYKRMRTGRRQGLAPRLQRYQRPTVPRAVMPPTLVCVIWPVQTSA